MGLFRGRSSFVIESDRWYLGIWLKKFPETVIWVANRESPLSNPRASLQISKSDILLLNESGGQLWKTHKARQYRFSTEALVMELRDTGNFILRCSTNHSDPDGILWQSFDEPTDRILFSPV
ncbi:unnamed protein product [Microthlaspi erraticum]|uniref:Bulb-type lectin domain-containing protein n=1 Tax=Microthlaspi erraticum TaxID=1685480 RepID=A0A6D2KGW8_9BRAS|nr:unnamed protein product [Microthlaspi erraticum]